MNTSDPAFVMEVDASGLKCPLPILRAKKALAQMQANEVLRVVTTDPGAIRDFEAFARQTGNTLLLQRDEGECCVHYLRRRA
ncbi:sulfurtransferase TusA family protein [Kerstersia similis]|uniref:sulfurtransferase TusA family protein n=1 Tax=Kerstersia similis TaxID=206505 RepID=UPI0039EE15E7